MELAPVIGSGSRLGHFANASSQQDGVGIKRFINSQEFVRDPPDCGYVAVAFRFECRGECGSEVALGELCDVGEIGVREELDLLRGAQSWNSSISTVAGGSNVWDHK